MPVQKSMELDKWPQIILTHVEAMSSEQQKVDVESLSSLSVDPKGVGLGNSNIFGGRKSSFDYVNILKVAFKSFQDSDQLPRRDFRNSLDILSSNLHPDRANPAPIKEIIQLYNDENKVKIEQYGLKALELGQVFSESEEQQRPEPRMLMTESFPESRIKLQTVYNESKFNYHSYFPHDLAEVLRQRQIPLQYVKGLLMVRDQKQIKTTRRLKVERYLQKRRIKTWNRKICYNCRQRVAEQRLRIKGKFIKKRRAMEILGLTIPIDTAKIKEKLYAFMRDKDNAEIQELLKVKKTKKEEEDGEDADEDEDEGMEADGHMENENDNGYGSLILEEENESSEGH